MSQYPISAQIISTGVYLPEKKEDINDFLKKGLSQELIDKVGIYEHRVCRVDEGPTDMEKKAALIALKRAGLDVLDIDLILSTSVMREDCVLPNSNLLQAKLEAKNAAAFDINLACCGVIPQFMIAANFIALKQYKYILLTTSTDWNRILNPHDVDNAAVLSDGASAAIMGPVSSPWGFVAFDLQTEGKHYYKCGTRVMDSENNILNERYYESRAGRLYFFIDDDIKDKSSEWVKYLRNSVPKTLDAVLAKANLNKSDIDMLVLHQNIGSIINSWIELSNVDKAKAVTTHHKYGNLAAANILTNLNELIESNRLKKGDIVAIAGQGGGFSVGSAILRWNR